MKPNLTHYLISLSTFNDRIIHAYLVTNDKRTVTWASDTMIKAAEKEGLRLLPIVLCTTLEASGVAIVQDHLRRYGDRPEIADLLDSIDDFHVSMFWASERDSADLMDLH